MSGAPRMDHPRRKPMRQTGCRVALQAYQAKNLAGGLLSVMRRLRRDLARCETCSRYPGLAGAQDCPVAAYLNNAIHQSLEEINHEWEQAVRARLSA